MPLDGDIKYYEFESSAGEKLMLVQGESLKTRNVETSLRVVGNETNGVTVAKDIFGKLKKDPFLKDKIELDDHVIRITDADVKLAQIIHSIASINILDNIERDRILGEISADNRVGTDTSFRSR